jgi:hypothetical protein
MPCIERLLSISAIIVMLVGCGVRDARFAQSHFQVTKPVLPPDTVAPSKGVFAMAASTDPADMCCWTAQDAEIDVRKFVPSAQWLTLGMMTPGADAFASREQSVRVIFVGRNFETVVHGVSGKLGVFRIALPARVGDDGTGIRKIELRFASAYVPGGDERYGALLTSAYFER